MKVKTYSTGSGARVTLPENEREPLSKAEEKALLGRMIAEVPAGYVRDILAGMQHEIEWAIDSDFGFVTIGERFREMQEHKAEILEAEKKLAELKAEIAQRERMRDTLEEGINELRSTIARYSRI